MIQDTMQDIINRIHRKRIELGYSFQDLSERTGMSKSTLQRYETGGIKNIPLDKLKVLAVALNVTPEWVMGWEDNAQPKKEKELLTNTEAALLMQKVLEEKGVISPGGDLTKEQADVIINYISANADFLKDLIQKHK